MMTVKRFVHFGIVLVLLTLVLGTMMSACSAGKDMDVQTIAQHISELQTHPFPPHSIGEISIKSPLMRRKWEVEIWSDRSGDTRMEFESGEIKGDYIVTNATEDKSLEYHHAENTYTVTKLGSSPGAQPVSDLLPLVEESMRTNDFKYGGISRVAGVQAYEIEIKPKSPDLSIGLDDITLWVDPGHWTLLALKTKSSSTVMEWKAREVDFDSRPDRKLFALIPPEGARRVQPEWQKGTHVVDLKEAKDMLGRNLLVPHWLPKGYKLVEMRTGSGSNASVGMLYRKRSLLGTKEITIAEIAVKERSGPLGIENCKNENVKVNGLRAVYSKCKIGSTLMWNEDGLQILISGFESEGTLLKIAESMRQ